MILSLEASKMHKKAKKVGKPAVWWDGTHRKVKLFAHIAWTNYLQNGAECPDALSRSVEAADLNLLLPAPSAHPHKTMWNAHLELKNLQATANQALQKIRGTKSMGGMKVDREDPWRRVRATAGAGRGEGDSRDSRNHWLMLLKCHLNYPWQKNSD